MQMKLNVVSYRHGKIDDGPNWIKVTALDSEAKEYNGFRGFATDEYSAQTDFALQLTQQLSRIKSLPAEIIFDFVHQRKSGQMTPLLTCISQ